MTDLPQGASPVDAIAPGTRLREWEVVRLRGRGSYGVVFEARKSSWLEEPSRALKVFDPIVSTAARRALMSEFSTLTDVRHPHLLDGLDAFDLDTPPYAGCVVFVLELADEDLATRVARVGPLPAQEVAAVGAELAEGLAALHQLGRVHGDVKPENILRVGDRWVLGDFGVTGVLEGSYAVTPGATVDYRPPELASAEPGTRLHRSTDVWALGVSLHVAATGRHPFPGPDPMLRYAAVVRGDRSPGPGFDPHLASVIDTACLQPDPHSRADADALRSSLLEVVGGAHPTTRSEVETPASPPRHPAPTTDASSRVGARTRIQHRLYALSAAVLTTAVVCQMVALVAGVLPLALSGRRGLYLAATLAVLVAAVGVVAPKLWDRRTRGAPWRDLRPWAVGGAFATWLIATTLLFGAAG